MAIITMNLWIIALIEETSGPVKPVFYYNPHDDTWSRESKLGMGFAREDEAYDKLKELGVHADVVAVKAELK